MAADNVVPFRRRPPRPAEERCERSDLPASMCAHCRGHDQTVPDLSLRDLGHKDVHTAFTARYEGTCENCGAHIDAGDLIAPLIGGSGHVCPDCLP